jgi:hypothetical protein
LNRLPTVGKPLANGSLELELELEIELEIEIVIGGLGGRFLPAAIIASLNKV